MLLTIAKSSALLQLVFIVSVTASARRFDGDQVVAITASSAEDWARVLDILGQHMSIEHHDVWKEPTKTRPGYVRIPNEFSDRVYRSFADNGIEYHVTINDVQSLITKTEQEIEAKKMTRRNERDIVGTFPTYTEVLAWINDLTVQYPEIASTFSIGTTYQGRRQQVLKLGFAGSKKWKVWLDSGLHAREWLSVSTAVYVVDQLIQGYVNNDPVITEFLQKLDFHILPVANPDGYDYCFTGDRLWRKNRRPNSGTSCVGVDLNRNFGYQWGAVSPDYNPCSNLYLGPSIESELEVQNIINHVLPQADSFIMFKSYHTWGEQFFTRWDYSAAPSDLPLDHDELLQLARDAVTAIIAVNGEPYEAGVSPEIMYPFSGSISDWARGAAQIKYPYLTELRDSDGKYGFVAPVSEIIPCGQENWAGFTVLLRNIIAKYGDIPPPR